MSPKHRSPSGFTLLELLTVVVLIGVLASIGAPSLSGWLMAARVRGLSDRVVADIHLARMHAMRSGGAVELVVEWGPGRACVDAITIREMFGDGIAVKRVELDAYAPACLSMNNARRNLVFDSRGMPHGVMARTMTVRAGLVADTLVVSQLGRILRK